MTKVFAAMSGGVDSSVCALLLKNMGYDVIGVTMKLFERGNSEISDAKAVCDALGIEHIVCDFSREFRETVMRDFADTYMAGGTPNPCVVCNKNIKFKRLFEFADEKGVEKIATGHYARVNFDEGAGRYILRKGADEAKDQSYVLYSLSQQQLARTLFPLGEMTKVEIRELAAQNNFVTAGKHDSQDICFIPDGDYYGFIKSFTEKSFAEGDFVDKSGNILGRHKGIIKYTIGQRKGLGLALPCPMFVCEKDTENNRVVLGLEKDLYSSVLYAKDCNMICPPAIDGKLRVCARTRYKTRDIPATLTQAGDGRIKVEFDEPVRAVTPGQSVVFYIGDSVAGGGIIAE